MLLDAFQKNSPISSNFLELRLFNLLETSEDSELRLVECSFLKNFTSELKSFQIRLHPISILMRIIVCITGEKFFV